MPAWLRYALIRVGVFAVVFAVLLIIGFHYLWAGLIAAVVGFCVGFIFFRGQRDQVAEQLANRTPRRTSDESAEDGVDPDITVDDGVEDAVDPTPTSEPAPAPATGGDAPASEGDRRRQGKTEGE